VFINKTNSLTVFKKLKTKRKPFDLVTASFPPFLLFIVKKKHPIHPHRGEMEKVFPSL
jgi:hypothetical protein